MLALGCDENVDAIQPTELPYTVWGFMNAGADTQYVRVFPIRDHLLPDSNEEIDARVFSTDLNTGERRQWAYKTVFFDSLINGHIFWAPFRAEHEHRYRLEVVRSDEAMSSVEVKVPPEVSFDLQLDPGSNNTGIPVRLEGEIPNLIGMYVTYNAVNVPPKFAYPDGTPLAGAVNLPVTISYENLVKRQGNGWSVEINMVRDFLAVRDAFNNSCLLTEEDGSAPNIWLRTMEFSVVVADSTWAPPGGVFDPNVLSVPGTFSNVENGYGFFGAGEGIRRVWAPAVEASLRAGFNFVQRCDFLFPMPVAECMDPPVPCLDKELPSIWETWLQ